MIINSSILTTVKVMFIAIAILVSVASIQAQGVFLQDVNFGDASVVDTGSLSISLGDVNFIQPPLTPTTDGDLPSGFQPGFTSSLTIQSVPEPSTFALGSLAIGLIALVQLNRRQQVSKS